MFDSHCYLHFSRLSRSSPGTPQEPNNTAAVSDQVVKPVPLLLLVRLPRPQFGKHVFVLHDHVKVQPQEDRHPRLRELVVPPLNEALRQRADKLEELVGFFVAVTRRQRPQFEICRRGGEEFQVLDRVGV